MSVAHQNIKIAENIRQYGWHCLHVFSTEAEQQPFTYSIGFTQSFDAPEILVFGLPQEQAHVLLQECAQLFHNGHRHSRGKVHMQVCQRMSR